MCAVFQYGIVNFVRINRRSDMHRTFPDNVYFKDVPSDPAANVDALYNVLIALAHNNRKIGYCQVSIGFLLGLSLLSGKLLNVIVDNLVEQFA